MDSENTVVDFPTDQEQIASIIEDSFPKKNSDKDLGNPQSDANRLGARIFFYGFGQLLRSINLEIYLVEWIS